MRQRLRHTMNISRFDLNPYQFYLQEGDEVYITRNGGHYFLLLDSIVDEGENRLTISGELVPA